MYTPTTASLTMNQVYKILNVTRSAYPAVIIGLFVLCFIIFGVINSPAEDNSVTLVPQLGPGGRPLPRRRKSNKQIKAAVITRDFSPRLKAVFAGLSLALLITFIVNGTSILIQFMASPDKTWWPGQSAVVYILGSFFAWIIIFISIFDTKPSPTWVHLVTWSIAVPMEIIVLGSLFHIYTREHHQPKIGDQRGGRLESGATAWEVLEIFTNLSRILVLLTSIVLYVTMKLIMRKKTQESEDGTTTPLLTENGTTEPNGHANGHAYGTTTHGSMHKEQDVAWAKPKEAPVISWYSYLKGFVTLIPYLWPKKSVRLQIVAVVCFLIMLIQRVTNVFIPIFIGKITDILSEYNGNDKNNMLALVSGPRAPWAVIAVYIAFRWLQGSQGILGALRAVLWVPVEQYSYQALSTAAFEHVHNLSADFHTGKRTGELISALNKGSSINSFLEMVTFQVGPMIFDLLIAVVYLAVKFNVYLGLVVAIVTFLYIYVTIRLAAWRVTVRRDYTNADREMEAVKNDSLHAWETVKYFGAEEYEFNRFRKSIVTMQGFEYFVSLTLAVMNMTQGALFMTALLAACYIQAYQVCFNGATVGSFVLLITYMAQLQAPLNYFGSFYRAVQNALINSERMLELFKEQPHVVDSATAKPLETCQGEITFNHVHFGYDARKEALQSLSFHCAPGTTTALVGESGGGKSTIMRLLYRYYNPTAGSIQIDGQDVQDLTIDSLRSHIGVVPQDCNMFNESIMYNLRYANQSATDEEIFAACRAASIHDRIMGFADGYDTKVGERGVKLSGGERQRVAIARTILKNPKITLLDEATAALDSETEERIQEALRTLAVGRTMLIIAHRLSTIVDADQILVLSAGTVVEKGTHGTLLAMGGKYASMWRRQSRAQAAAEEAAELQRRAKRVVEEAMTPGEGVSEDEGAGEGKGKASRSDPAALKKVVFRQE